MSRRNNVKTVAFVGVLGALSCVLMLLRFPLPFVPGFYEFDIAELPALFAGFFLGPVAGCAVVFVKIVLKLIFQGSATFGIGDLSNLIYRRMHTKKGAKIALVVSTLVVSVVYVFLNAYIMLPMYASVYGLPIETIVDMGHAVNPWVNDTVTLMLFAVFPFNLVKHGATALLTYLLYKRVGNALRSMMGLSPDATVKS